MPGLGRRGGLRRRSWLRRRGSGRSRSVHRRRSSGRRPGWRCGRLGRGSTVGLAWRSAIRRGRVLVVGSRLLRRRSKRTSWRGTASSTWRRHRAWGLTELLLLLRYRSRGIPVGRRCCGRRGVVRRRRSRDDMGHWRRDRTRSWRRRRVWVVSAGSRRRGLEVLRRGGQGRRDSRRCWSLGRRRRRSGSGSLSVRGRASRGRRRVRGLLSRERRGQRSDTRSSPACWWCLSDQRNVVPIVHILSLRRRWHR